MDATWTTRAELEAKAADHYGLDTLARALEGLNFESLSARALFVRRQQDSTLPQDLKCHIDRERFAFGRYNIVFALEFSDGCRWVARIPCSNHDDVGDEMRQEVMTMNLVRERTTIPLPVVQDYNASITLDNDIGRRYMLMDYVKGDRLGSRNVPVEYHEKFVRQFANYFYQLSTLRFPSIGPIEMDDGIDDHIDRQRRPCPRSTLKNSLQYIYAQRSQINRGAHRPAWYSTDQALAAACQFLMQSIPLAIDADYMNGPFPMTHHDMHHHNILVDEDYNITAVIDWSNVQPMPVEIFPCNPLFETALGLSDEENAPIIKFRTDVAQEVHRLAQEARDHLGMRIADLIGSAKTQLASYLVFSTPRMVIVDAKIRVMRLLHEKETDWNDVERLIVNGPYFKQATQPKDRQPDGTDGKHQDLPRKSVLGKRRRK